MPNKRNHKRKPDSVLAEVWRSPEYKARCAKLMEEAGGVCEWCGHRKGDPYVDSKGVTRVRSMAVHHRNPPDIGLRAYKRLANHLLKSWTKINMTEWRELTMEARMSFPYEATDADAKRRAEFNWAKEHRQRISEAYEEHRAKVIMVYSHPTGETAIVSCSRCHTAREKGKVICRVCRERYHDPRHQMCLVCVKAQPMSLISLLESHGEEDASD